MCFRKNRCTRPMETILGALAETENDLLTCPICLTSFDCPKVLVCLHTFCLSCLINHQVTSGSVMAERLPTVTERERRMWQRIQEQPLEHEEPLAETYGESQEPGSDESAGYQLHHQVGNEGQQEQQQQRQQQQCIRCPICRELTALPDSGLLGLRNDFRLDAFSKSLEAIWLQCKEIIPLLNQNYHAVRHSNAISSPGFDQNRHRKISRVDRICAADDERPKSIKNRKRAWQCIVTSFNKCLSASSVFDEDFTEVLRCK